jgi:hypothetical protein
MPSWRLLGPAIRLPGAACMRLLDLVLMPLPLLTPLLANAAANASAYCCSAEPHLRAPSLWSCRRTWIVPFHSDAKADTFLAGFGVTPSPVRAARRLAPLNARGAFTPYIVHTAETVLLAPWGRPHVVASLVATMPLALPSQLLVFVCHRVKYHVCHSAFSSRLPTHPAPSSKTCVIMFPSGVILPTPLCRPALCSPTHYLFPS